MSAVGLALGCLAACTQGVPIEDKGCVVFGGDVMLSRGVAAELDARGSPWSGLAELAGHAWIANLEGSLAPKRASCAKRQDLCLGIAPRHLTALRPFAGLGLANNHSRDYGEEGLEETVAALESLGIHALTEEGAPHLLQLAGRTWGIVPLDLAGRSGSQQAVERARLAIGLARAQTPRVLVFVHWGLEGEPRLAPEQKPLADIFHAWGATLVLGAHAHVPQAVDCGTSASTWYGLGNMLFDQLPEQSRSGLLVRCCEEGGQLACSSLRTRRPPRSTFPQLTEPGETCVIQLAEPPDTRWKAHPHAPRFEHVQAMRSAGPDAFIALERRLSSFDDEEGLRPYVFRAVAGGTQDLWRGTALSRPLVAARVIDLEGEELLCALHRGDSFLAPDPDNKERIRKAWRWDGFGFQGVPGVDCDPL